MENIKTDLAQFIFDNDKQAYIKKYDGRFSSLTEYEFKSTRQYVFESPFFIPQSDAMDYSPLNLSSLEKWIEENETRVDYTAKCYELTKELLEALLKVHRVNDALGLLTVKNVLVDDYNKIWFSEWSATTKQTIRISDLIETSISSFLAPELVNREHIELSTHSDQYSLGVLLYQIFTKINPFQSEKVLDTIYRHKTLVPDLPTKYNLSLGSSMAEFIIKLLNKNPESRFDSIESARVLFEECHQLFIDDRLDENLQNTELAKNFFKLNAANSFIQANIHHLREAYDEMNSRGLASVCLIEGENGVQKSRFIQAFTERIAGENILSISVNLKVDEQIPLSSIKGVIKEISNYFLTLSDEEVNSFTSVVNSRLGLALSVIQELYPEIADVIPVAIVKSSTKGFELKSQLVFAVAEFLKAVIDTKKVLIIHFKGVHFATKNTLAFLTGILKEFPFKQLFFIFSYEKKQLNTAQDEFIFKSEFRNTGQLLFNEINLRSFTESDIVRLLEHSQVESNQIPLSAEILHSKTGGLPRFLDEIIQNLISDNKVLFDTSSQNWRIDNQALLQSTNYTEDVTGLYRRKIQTFGNELRHMLSSAAIIGDTFPIIVLEEIYPFQTFDSVFEELLNSGFFTKIDDKKGAFADATISKLVKEDISTEEITQTNIKVIDAFQEKIEDLEASDFFNVFLEKIIESREFKSEAEWLDKGIDVAMRIADFELAYKYSTYLSQKENIEDWQRNRSKVFNRKINRINIATLNLNFDEALEVYTELKDKQLKDYEDIELENTYSEALLTVQKYEQSIRNATSTLKKYNLSVNENPSTLRVIISSIRMSILMKGKDWEYFKNLEPMQDPTKIALVYLIQITVGPAFLVNPKMIPELIFRQMSLGVKYGFSIHIGVSIGCYAFLNANFQQKFKEAKKLFQLAAKVDDLCQNNTNFLVNRFMYCAFVQPWFDNFRDTKNSLIENFRLCRQSGLGSIAFYNFNFIVQTLIISEERIVDLESELKEILIYLKENTPQYGDDLFLVTLYYFQTLGYTTEDNLIKENYKFDISEIEKRVKKQGDTSDLLKLAYLLRVKIYLSFINEDYEINDEHVEITKSVLNSQGPGYYMLSIFNYNVALNYIKSKNSKRYKKQISQAIKILKKASKVMPQNYEAKTYFLEGLYAVSNNNKEIGLYKLQKAYHLAVENRELLTQGLIARELAYCYEDEGMESQQNFFFKHAIIHFDNYKASNLSKKIIEKYPQYSVVQKAGLNISQKINLQSFISASTSIAAEIKLEALLEKMMVILAENAGAEKVLFIIPTVHNFEIIASKNKESLIIDNKSAANESHVPLSILNYVKRTHKHVLLQTANKDSRYLNDAYIRSNEILSVLCIPVIKNLQLLGIIYFENNLINSAFTEENTETLKLLASQIAVSFENSQLYEHMERKIEERTQKLNESLNTLRTTQKQLIQNEKLASLGELTAGIAHEIQNPLNFVNNFSEVSNELLQELKEELDKGDINEAKAISDDVIQNLDKISYHGHRASSIVKGMLEHSRTSSGKKELTDINTLADEYLRLSFHGLRAKDKGFNAEIITNFDPTLPKIKVIPQDIGRVLLNLINNAFQAVHERDQKGIDGYKPKVTISTSQELNADSTELIAIRIKDNGSGISDEIKDKIFQPFFTTKPTGKGTGLGLSLAYDIVKAHEGEINIFSASADGAEFVISLPKETS